MGPWVALAILVVAGILLVLQHDAGSIAGLELGDVARIAACLALLVYIGVPMLRRYEGQLAKGLRDALIWVALALLLITGYTFRAELGAIAGRLGGELRPAGTSLSVQDAAPGESAVRLRKRDDGHFIAKAEVNGEAVTMIIDTGASTVVLKPADAERAGIDLTGLTYAIPVQTANGTAFAARVRLKSVAIGPLQLKDVEGLIARPGALDESLLGMSFLSRLRSYEFSGDYLTLRG